MTERDIHAERDTDEGPAATEADRYEQQRSLVDDDPEPRADDSAVPDDVDPGDAQEQRLPVDYDEDDYR